MSLSDAVAELPGVVGPGTGVGNERDERVTWEIDVLESGVPSVPEGEIVAKVVIDDRTLEVGR